MKNPSRIIMDILIIFVVIAAGSSGLFQISKSRSFQFCGGIVGRMNTPEKNIALTFDDGPTVQNTDKTIMWEIEPEFVSKPSRSFYQ